LEALTTKPTRSQLHIPMTTPFHSLVDQVLVLQLTPNNNFDHPKI
jgi:hypothetical protein